MVTADLAAAQRAADELVDAGVGRVLLFGSVARGEAGAMSDVDLVAIYDDLDYKARPRLRCDLERQARTAAGCSVDVMVTDAPEWRVRTTEVRSSVEASVARYAVELADAGGHDRIDWGKEIGLPDSDTGELRSRITDMGNAAASLKLHLRIDPDEEAEADRGHTDRQRYLEGVRFGNAMGDVHMLVESAAKAMHVYTLGTAPERTHDVSALLAPQPQYAVRAFVDLAGPDIDLGALHLWRQGATYLADRPDLPTEQELRSHSEAALRVGNAVVEQCRSRLAADSALEEWDQTVTECGQALRGSITAHRRHDRGDRDI